MSIHRVRILRVIEYEGTLEWVAKCIETRQVKGSHRAGGTNVIREAIVGNISGILEEAEEGERDD